MTSNSPIDTSSLGFAQKMTDPDFLTALSEDEMLVEPFDPRSKGRREMLRGLAKQEREFEWERKRRQREHIRRSIERAKRLQDKMKTL
jgi:hypothetical protein